jgi:mRNA interferase MazF
MFMITMTNSWPNINPKRGDVVLVLFPNSELRTGKKRPALVVQADNLQTGINQIVVAMVTSNMSRGGHPSRVTISSASTAGKNAGLSRDSVVMTDNLMTVLLNSVDRVIGTLPMAIVDSALRRTLAL